MRLFSAFILLLPFMLFAESNVFSNIPPAKIEVININPEPCSKSCLKDLSKKGKILSFIARFDKSIDDEDLQNLMMQYSNAIGIYYKVRFDTLGKKLEVALLIPKKTIGKYSTTTTDTILAYLLSRDLDFRFKVFDSIDENANSLSNAINNIKKENFNFVIAIVSKQESLDVLSNLNIPVYVPTMSRNAASSNITFGGIDYNAQIKDLLDKVDTNKIVAYNDDSSLGSYIGSILETQNNNKRELAKEVVTNKAAANFSSNLAKRRSSIRQSSIFLNTRVIISGLLLSQIGLLDNLPKHIFSTQVNYNPNLLSLVRGFSTSNIVISNAIGTTDDKLVEYGYLLTSDMKYDWVNYSTALGVDLFLHNMSPSIERYFKEEIENNAVIYENTLYGIENGAFVKL